MQPQSNKDTDSNTDTNTNTNTNTNTDAIRDVYEKINKHHSPDFYEIRDPCYLFPMLRSRL